MWENQNELQAGRICSALSVLNKQESENYPSYDPRYQEVNKCFIYFAEAVNKLVGTLEFHFSAQINICTWNKYTENKRNMLVTHALSKAEVTG